MASSSSQHNASYPSPSLSSGLDPNSTLPNTTFVQADPSNFRAVVQRLTGATSGQEAKLPVTSPARLSGKPLSGEMGPRRPAFKLHERRQSARKLEIKLNNYNGPVAGAGSLGSPSSGVYNSATRQRSFVGFNGEMMMVSPVSPFEFLGRGTSPRTPRSPSEEEERAIIAEKGYYLHPSPLSTPRGGSERPPELLPLFPLTSPKARDDHSSLNHS